MKFSGERFISNQTIPEITADMSYEHWHRYFYASIFAKDKVVLDIASGEGYGSYLLSKTASNVTGVDIDEESIRFAKKTYINKNLEFIVGSAASIPIEGEKIFDVITSFETIEHITEELQRLFLGEVKRLLKDNGIFVVSTPNKLTFSDIPKLNNEYRNNEFHIKELYVPEFNMLLKNYFSHVSMLGQKIFASSYIWPEETHKDTQLAEFLVEHTEAGFALSDKKKESLFAIALCSNHAIKEQSSSLLVDLANQYLNGLTKRINNETMDSRLFIDAGEGYTQQTSISMTIGKCFDDLVFDLSNYQSISSLRFDPYEGHWGHVKLTKVSYKVRGQAEQDLLLESVTSNGVFREDGATYFETFDPMFFLPLSGALEYVSISGYSKLLSIEEAESALQLKNRELQSIYNSEMWKMFVMLKMLANKTKLVYPAKWVLRLYRKFTGE